MIEQILRRHHDDIHQLFADSAISYLVLI